MAVLAGSEVPNQSVKKVTLIFYRFVSTDKPREVTYIFITKKLLSSLSFRNSVSNQNREKIFLLNTDTR